MQALKEAGCTEVILAISYRAEVRNEINLRVEEYSIGLVRTLCAVHPFTHPIDCSGTPKTKSARVFHFCKKFSRSLRFALQK